VTLFVLSITPVRAQDINLLDMPEGYLRLKYKKEQAHPFIDYQSYSHQLEDIIEKTFEKLGL